MSQIKCYIKLMRPKHWIKNGLIFLPLVTSHKLFDLRLFSQVCVGTLMFCLVSSVVYILNDIHDAESDRRHTKKRNRPIASGAVSKPAAKILIGALLTVTVLCGVFVLDNNTGAWIILGLYLIINIFYSMALKHIALADVFALASGYPLRIYFCSALTGIEISEWLFLTLTVGALFLALGKRYGEMMNESGEGKTRRVLLQYSTSFLDKAMYMCQALAIVFYSLWSIDGPTVYTVPLVLAIFMRYNLLLERDKDGDPVDILTEDKPLLIICGMYIALFIALLYST